MTEPIMQEESTAAHGPHGIKLFIDTVLTAGFIGGKFIHIYNFGESFSVTLNSFSPSITHLREIFHKQQSIQVNLLTKAGLFDFTGKYILTDVVAGVAETPTEIEFNFVRERRRKEDE